MSVLDTLTDDRLAERLRRRLDRTALEIGDLTEEAITLNLPATADALGRACRLLFLVAGPPDGEWPTTRIERNAHVPSPSDV